MQDAAPFHPASPLLRRAEPTLPASWYYDPARFAEERAKIWARTWVYVGRNPDLAPMTMRRLSVAGENLILVKDQSGAITAFHNTCRHRGAELCIGPEQALQSRLISCPYHQWSYDFSGQLVRTPWATPTADFKRSEHGLFAVHVRLWNGGIFVCLADSPPDFAKAPDLGEHALDHWPMADLKTGHRHVLTLNCNWKIFWENYNECLHCPGVHPGLSARVPVYAQGIMAAEEAADWTPATPSPSNILSHGARSWTVNGAPCGPEFPNLSPVERAAGHTFVTLMPTMFMCAHVDYVRVVSMQPLGPEQTEITAEWLFPEETLAAPDFDLANVVDFARTVLTEDGAACEMNQRGIRTAKYTQGTLMPQEYAVFQVHEWVRRAMSAS